jgi:hypothetical protein
MTKTCDICGNCYDDSAPLSEFAEAGEWLAKEVWLDAGKLCPVCLENRTRLVLMYCPEYNS